MTAQLARRGRRGNSALDYILATYETKDEKLATLIASIPNHASVLYSAAGSAARSLLRGSARHPFLYWTQRVLEIIVGATSAKETALTLSVFDLESTVYFSEL